MKADLGKTFSLVTGGMARPPATWQGYLATNPSWQETLIVLTAPLFLVSLVLSTVLGRATGGVSAYAARGTLLTELLLGLVAGAVAFLVTVFVLNFFAGIFKGKPDFSRAFAAVSLAAIPAWVFGIAGAAIPWLGGLVSLVGAIWSLVLLYRILPLALDIPQGKRVVHYVVSLLVVIVVNAVIAVFLYPTAFRSGIIDPTGVTGDPVSSGSGLMATIRRQGDIVDAANADTYDPPADGRVSETQARELVSVLEKAGAAFDERTSKIKNMATATEDGKAPSASDILDAYKSIGTVASLQNLEMEVVKSADGNWAEYAWVKQQLRVASLQRGEGSAANAHNFALYEKYRDALSGAL
jgi:hypothetical protein